MSRLSDRIIDLRLAAFDLKAIEPDTRSRAVYLRQLSAALDRIASKGQRLGADVLNDISSAVELAYKAGLSK